MGNFDLSGTVSKHTKSHPIYHLPPSLSSCASTRISAIIGTSVANTIVSGFESFFLDEVVALTRLYWSSRTQECDGGSDENGRVDASHLTTTMLLSHNPHRLFSFDTRPHSATTTCIEHNATLVALV